MRTCALILYLDNDKSLTNRNEVFYDTWGITKNVEQVLKDYNRYSGKIDLLPSSQISLYVVVKNPSTNSGWQKMSDAEKAYFEGFTFPFLAFYDVTEERTFGILNKRDATQYNAVKSALDVIANTKEFTDKGYRVEIGNETYFMQDARNAHLQTGGTEINPKHSLLDLVYIGANVGVFDKPYARNFVNDVVDAVKQYWWLGALAIGGFIVYNETSKSKKRKRKKV
jgi:hypothetical protein